MITLKIPDAGELQFIVDEDCERFSECELKYIALNGEETQLYTDYLYVFVEEMLAILNNICVVPENPDQGSVISMGKWQEYYYFDRQFFRENEGSISLMEKSTFMSGDRYCMMLYSYGGITWLELNQCYESDSMMLYRYEGIIYPEFDESANILPAEFYSTPDNYQIFIVPISNETIMEWKHCLEPLHKRVCF